MKVNTRMFLEKCHKYQIGTEEMELTARRMESKASNPNKRNVKNVKKNSQEKNCRCHKRGEQSKIRVHK